MDGFNLEIQSGPAFNIGALLGTSDGGRRWNFVEGDPGKYGEILLQENRNGWLTHDDGRELYTTLDGGRSFHVVTLQEPSGIPFSVDPEFTVYNLPIFEDNLRGYETALYTNDQGSKSAMVLFTTNDGGKTWTVDRKLTGLGASSPGTLAMTSMTDSTWIVPIASGTQPTLVTLAKASTAGYPSVAYNGVRASSFITPTQGWISCRSGLLSTLDGGHTWYHVSPTYAVGGGLGSSFTGNAAAFDKQTSTVPPVKPPTVATALAAQNSGKPASHHPQSLR